MVINVAAFCENENMTKDLCLLAHIREKTLNECYSIPGYADLCKSSPKEACKIYDKTHEKYMKEA